MTSLRIVMVDLDTSHPTNWLPVVRALGHDVVGVFDSGTVYPGGHANAFADKHNIARVYGSLDEIARDRQVDVVFLHGCDFDLHIERARPFVEAGKAILVDKPLASRVRDVRQLVQWERDGVRITGGSALRYCPEVVEWRATHDPGSVVVAYAGCAVDEFNYGIHAYSLLHGLLGPGIESVRHLGIHGQHQVELTWTDGRRAEVSVGTLEGYLPFYATVATGTDLTQIKVDSARLYRSLLETVLPYLSGGAPAPVAMEALVEPELAAIAATVSAGRSGERVNLADLTDDDHGYDGKAFAAWYRAKQLGGCT